MGSVRFELRTLVTQTPKKNFNIFLKFLLKDKTVANIKQPNEKSCKIGTGRRIYGKVGR